MCQILNLPDIQPAGYPADLKKQIPVPVPGYPAMSGYQCSGSSCQVIKVLPVLEDTGSGYGYENYDYGNYLENVIRVNFNSSEKDVFADRSGSISGLISGKAYPVSGRMPDKKWPDIHHIPRFGITTGCTWKEMVSLTSSRRAMREEMPRQ